VAADRDDLKAWSKNDLVREVVKLRALLAKQMSAAPGVGDQVTIDALVSSETGEPVVEMRAGEVAWQFTAAQARSHTHGALEAAIEADRDAAVVAFMREAEFEEGQIGAFLHDMREHRTVFIEARESEAG
jgi:hypothetical protein